MIAKILPALLLHEERGTRKTYFNECNVFWMCFQRSVHQVSCDRICLIQFDVTPWKFSPREKGKVLDGSQLLKSRVASVGAAEDLPSPRTYLLCITDSMYDKTTVQSTIFQVYEHSYSFARMEILHAYTHRLARLCAINNVHNR